MVLLQRQGEGLGLGGLGAGRAVGVQRMAHDQRGHAMLADEAGDGFEVGPQLGAMQGEERLRDQAQRVGDGQPDAPVSDIERENTFGCHRISVPTRAPTLLCAYPNALGRSPWIPLTLSTAGAERKIQMRWPRPDPSG